MPTDRSRTRPEWAGLDPNTLHNVRAESYFSAFNGIYMGLAILAAPVVAVTGVQADPFQLTILVAAFPVGVFFGPLWAGAGRRLGMQRLVTQMAFWANLPLFLIFKVSEAWQFTLLIAISQILNSGMRMGQSSLYHLLYPREIRGRVLGKLTFWTFFTMVPSILVTGWLIDMNREMYRVLYPMAGLCGLIGCYYYSTLRLAARPPAGESRSTLRATVRGVQNILAQDRAFLFFQAAFFLSGASFFMSTHIVLLLVCERFDFSAFDLALWMTVVPQLLLALSSPLWGHVLDRVGIVHCRLYLAFVQSASMGSYALGVIAGLPGCIYLGSILLGLTNGGGQLTWALASSHFAPRPEDVPLYNGIHFVLNGVRGLLMPWVGSVLWVMTGPGAVVAALLTSCASIPVIMRSLRLDRLRPVPPAEGDPAALGTPDAEPPLPDWLDNDQSPPVARGNRPSVTRPLRITEQREST